MIKRVLLFVVLGVFSLASLDAQVMWNVKGGLMPWSIYDGSSYEKETSLEWMAGLEIEVPLSSKFNIETGLRFRKHETYNDYEYYRNRDVNIVEVAVDIDTLPLFIIQDLGTLKSMI